MTTFLQRRRFNPGDIYIQRMQHTLVQGVSSGADDHVISTGTESLLPITQLVNACGSELVSAAAASTPKQAEPGAFHRALTLPPAWQLPADGNGHVLPNAGSNDSSRSIPSSPSPKLASLSADTLTAEGWPKHTLLSEAYPPGARTPLRRSPTPDEQPLPPQLPTPEEIAMQLLAAAAAGPVAKLIPSCPSPYDDGMVPEHDVLQSRARVLAAAEEIGYHNGIGRIVSLGAAGPNTMKKDVPGFDAMLRATAVPVTRTIATVQQVQQVQQPAKQVQNIQLQQQNTGFDDLDDLGLLAGLISPRTAGPAADASAAAAPMLFGSNSKNIGVAVGGPAAGMRIAANVNVVAQVPEAGSHPGMPVLTAAPVDSPFGSTEPFVEQEQLERMEEGEDTTNPARRSEHASKNKQQFNNSNNDNKTNINNTSGGTSGGAAKSGKGRRAVAMAAARGTAGKGVGGNGAGTPRSGSGAGKKPAAPITRPVRAVHVPVLIVNKPAFVNKAEGPSAPLAHLDASGLLDDDHKPARGRGRQLQLAKMTPAQKKAEAKARLEKNRQAARGFRARRKNHVYDLEQQIVELERRDQARIQTIQDLQQQLAQRN